MDTSSNISNTEELPEEDIQDPIPSAEQEVLWEKIDTSLTEEKIQEELDLLELDINNIAHLSSLALASNIRSFGEKHALTPSQKKLISQLLRDIALEKASPKQIPDELQKNFPKIKDVIADPDFEKLLIFKRTSLPKEESYESKPSVNLPHNNLLRGADMPHKAEALQPITTPVQNAQPTPPPQENDTKIEETKKTQMPFMLHEEKSSFSPYAPLTKPSVSFDIRKLSPKNEQPTRAVSAKIESPRDAGEKKESARVVHYTEFRTPLTDTKDTN